MHGRTLELISEHYTISYKGLEHLQILLSVGSAGTIILGQQRTAILGSSVLPGWDPQVLLQIFPKRDVVGECQAGGSNTCCFLLLPVPALSPAVTLPP